MIVACIKNVFVFGKCVCLGAGRKQLRMHIVINDVLAIMNHCLGCAKISDFEILRS